MRKSFYELLSPFVGGQVIINRFLNKEEVACEIKGVDDLGQQVKLIFDWTAQLANCSQVRDDNGISLGKDAVPDQWLIIETIPDQVINWRFMKPIVPSIEKNSLSFKVEASGIRLTFIMPRSEYSVNPFLVKVDRSVKPHYPDLVREVLHYELESEGPTEFDLRTGLTQWLHVDQINRGATTGHIIYDHLEFNEMLPSCLNLRDGYAIIAVGIVIFRKLFQGKKLFLWKSAVRCNMGRLWAPYLCEEDGQVVVHWKWFDVDTSDVEDDSPALRFVDLASS